MTQPLLVLFDCDGVLVDSEIVAARVQSEKLTEYGIEIDAEQFAIRFAGLTWQTIVERLQAEYGVSFAADFREKIDAEIDERLASDVEEIAGAREMLEALQLPRCICSNSSMKRLEGELDHVGLIDHFAPYIFSAPEVGTKKSKPAPDVYLYACEEFQVDPKRCVVIEDSVHGVAAAAGAGCRVVGFTGASHTYPGHADALTEAGAETVVSRLADFPAVVAALGEWQEV